MPKTKRPFLSGYKTYDPEVEGHGSPAQWKDEFRVRMDLDEVNSVLGDDSPHMILGLPPRFTAKQLKKAYLRKAHEWHPDRNRGNEELAEINFKKIQAAYVKLGGT